MSDGTIFERSGMNRLYNRAAVDPKELCRSPGVSSVQVKSVVAWPTDGLKLPAGRYAVWGLAAVSGRRCEIRKLFHQRRWWGNNGNRLRCKTAGESTCMRPAGDSEWERWTPGDYAVMSCAEDVAGGYNSAAQLS